MVEEWRDISGWEGFYQISDHGNVRSLDRVVTVISAKRGTYTKTLRGSALATYTDNDGYVRLVFSRAGRQTIQLVHRLVAEAFVLNPSNHPQVDHINGVRNINLSNNLRWVDRSTNGRNRHAILGRSGIVGVALRRNRPSPWQVQVKDSESRKCYLGCFKTQEEATAVYRAFRQRHFNA